MEEVLLPEKITEERVERFTKMPEEIWAERGRLIAPREGNVLPNGTMI